MSYAFDLAVAAEVAAVNISSRTLKLQKNLFCLFVCFNPVDFQNVFFCALQKKVSHGGLIFRGELSL